LNLSVYCEENSDIRKDNLSLIEEINNKFANILANQLSIDKIKINNINVNQHSSSIFLQNIISTEFSNKKLLSMDSISYNLNINIIENNIYYDKIKNSKKQLKRIAKSEFQYSIMQNNNESSSPKLNAKNNSFSLILSDTINISEIEWLERSELPFTKSPLPPEKKSFFDNYISPVIVASASVLTIILLFSVRSK